MNEKPMELKQIIYGLLKIKGSHSFAIAEEEVLRNAVGYLADRLFDLETAVARAKQNMIDQTANSANLQQSRIRAEVKDR